MLGMKILPSRMNKAVVVFVEKEDIVNQMISDRIVVIGDFLN